jgi:hypothetical protein
MRVKKLVAKAGQDFFGETLDLREASEKFGFNITSINNFSIHPYNESEIKDRVIHLLKDMIAAGY